METVSADNIDIRLRELVENELIGLCITPEYRGYRCLCLAVELTVCDEALLYNITTRLYKTISQLTGISAANVERSIRTVITVMWNEAERDKLNALMGRAYAAPPGNARFIGVMSRRIAYKYERQKKTE